MSTTTTPKHSRKLCQHCDSKGYRLDFYGLDHWGNRTQVAQRCEAGTSPCPDHRCYWWPTPAQLLKQAAEVSA